LSKLVAFLSAIFAIAACDRPYEIPTGSPGDEAEFRARARDMYQSLLMPSCEPLEGFDRREHLSEEFRAIDRFEQQMRSAPVWPQLMVAREDATYGLEREKRCWSHSSTVWAEKHVEMTQEQVVTILPQLQALAPSLAPLPASFANQPRGAAEFRYRVRELLTGVSGFCPFSESLSNEDLLRPALEIVADLKDELVGTPFADQFAVAEADAAQTLSETLVECATPSKGSAELLMQELTSNAREEAAAIMSISGSNGRSPQT
jgi:hypothetical protein